MLPHVTQHTLDDPIDRAVLAGDGKEVGDPDQEDHDVDGETAHDVLEAASQPATRRHHRRPRT